MAAKKQGSELVSVRLHVSSFGLRAGEVVKVGQAEADRLVANGHASVAVED